MKKNSHSNRKGCPCWPNRTLSIFGNYSAILKRKRNEMWNLHSFSIVSFSLKLFYNSMNETKIWNLQYTITIMLLILWNYSAILCKKQKCEIYTAFHFYFNCGSIGYSLYNLLAIDFKDVFRLFSEGPQSDIQLSQNHARWANSV